jgi:hypothetical protein
MTWHFNKVNYKSITQQEYHAALIFLYTRYYGIL